MRATYQGFKVEARKRVPLSAGGMGFTTVVDGFIVGDLQIEVDVLKLVLAIGGKALKSKARKSRLQGGAITVTATNIRKVAS